MTRVDGAGLLDPHDVETAVRQKPTRAVICQHASNVTGAIQPIADLADIAHDNGSVMLVDGAQGAGHLPVDIAKLGADAYATSGHKGLLGPQGIGLLYLSPAIDPQPLIEGGTGSGDSESERMPARRPERFEAGTMNVPGIVGLGAATRWLLEHGAEQRATERRLVERLHAGLSALPGITVLGPSVGVERVPVLTFVHERIDADHIALRLDHGYGIATRAGLHCAPWAHEAAGTLDRGAVRMGVGYGNTDEHITAALDALAEIIAGAT
jgi:selenocysteine lyase/cysteine desulfurase